MRSPKASFARATQADERYALAWANLGIARRDLGQDDAAAAALERAIALEPRHRLALTALAGLRRAQGRLDDAVRLYERALEVEPRDANAWLLCAGTLAERDDLGRRRARVREGGSLRSPTAASAGRASSHVADDSGERRRGARVAGALRAQSRHPRTRAARARAANAGRAGRRRASVDELPAGLSRRGRPAVAAGAMRDAVGAAIDAVQPSWRAPLRRAARGARDACASGSARRSSARARSAATSSTGSRTCRASASRSSSTTFRPGQDDVAQRLAARADRFRPCPRMRPSQVAAVIREDAPDVLVYPELGMDATTFAVASLRLAPLQCAAWGHPVTTGHATIDVFFTAGAMEPADAASHYRERLVALPGIGTRYARPAVPPDRARRAGVAGRRGALPVAAIAVQADARRRRAARARARRGALVAHRHVRGPAPGAHAALSRAAGCGLRGGRRGARRPRDRAPAVPARPVPRGQSRVRRDARHAALVRRQHHARCDRLRPAGGHAARTLHARLARARRC